MEVSRFSDAEINLIAIFLQKGDPMGVMAEAQSALAKIRQYATERTQKQAAEAAELEGAE